MVESTHESGQQCAEAGPEIAKSKEDYLLPLEAVQEKFKCIRVITQRFGEKKGEGGCPPVLLRGSHDSQLV